MPKCKVTREQLVAVMSRDPTPTRAQAAAALRITLPQLDKRLAKWPDIPRRSCYAVNQITRDQLVAVMSRVPTPMRKDAARELGVSVWKMDQLLRKWPDIPRQRVGGPDKGITREALMEIMSRDPLPSLEAAGKHFGVSGGTIYRHLERWPEIQRRRHFLIAARKLKAVMVREPTPTIKEAASELGVGRHVVERLLAKHPDIPRRKGGQTGRQFTRAQLRSYMQADLSRTVADAAVHFGVCRCKVYKHLRQWPEIPHASRQSRRPDVLDAMLADRYCDALAEFRESCKARDLSFRKEVIRLVRQRMKVWRRPLQYKPGIPPQQREDQS